MAIRRKPLSARVVATLKAKAKKSKLFNFADLQRLLIVEVKVHFFLMHLVADQEYQWFKYSIGIMAIWDGNNTIPIHHQQVQRQLQGYFI